MKSKQLDPNTEMQYLDPDPYPNTFHDLNTATEMNLDLYSFGSDIKGLF